jgi:hypothetical protein
MSSETRVLVLRLLAYEVAAGKTSEPTQPAALLVYEKLRRPLSALAGVAGFRSLASRALTLAKPEAPSLFAVQITPDGYLLGLDKIELQNLHAGEGGVILLAQLLELLFTFIGEPLTLRMMQDVWPDAVFEDSNSGDGEEREHTR